MIHYHGTPLSGGAKSALALSGKHVFISHAHKDNCEMAMEMCQTFALDNGAFSAWKSGREFQLGAYCDWVNHYGYHPACDFFVLPDVINGTEAENKEMIDAAFELIDPVIWNKGWPVWHLHESLDWLEYLISSYPAICLGSSGEFAATETQGWWGRMSEAMEVCCDDKGRPRIPIHGLRMLSPTAFSHIPLRSADSTNVAQNISANERFGRGPYAPQSLYVRALVMMENIERHASATRWTNSNGVTKNMDLFG